MSKTEVLAPGPSPRTANWRAQLPTLIRVYGIVLTLILLLSVVTIGNPAFISQQNVFNMASQWAPAGIMADVVAPVMNPCSRLGTAFWPVTSTPM